MTDQSKGKPPTEDNATSSRTDKEKKSTVTEPVEIVEGTPQEEPQGDRKDKLNQK